MGTWRAKLEDGLGLMEVLWINIRPTVADGNGHIRTRAAELVSKCMGEEDKKETGTMSHVQVVVGPVAEKLCAKNPPLMCSE